MQSGSMPLELGCIRAHHSVACASLDMRKPETGRMSAAMVEEGKTEGARYALCVNFIGESLLGQSGR